jgi:tRNA 2-thiouridine synthesizing protein C
VIFLDDGVYTLVKGQNPAALDMKPLGEGFPGLSEVGIKEFFVHDQSLAERGLAPGDLVLPARVVSGAEIERLLAACSAVLPF